MGCEKGTRLLRGAGIAVILFFMVFSAGCATYTSSELAPDQEVPMEMTTFTFDRIEGTYDAFPEYRIVPGDVLDVLFQIRTWVKKEEFRLAPDHTIKIRFVHAPELDVEQRIRPDGTITLPYLGPIYVLEKTVDELTVELKGRYREILNIPELYVEVPDFRSSIKELKADLHTAPRGLSRLVTVRPDGFVTFPMVGDVNVAGKTVPEVNDFLNSEYERILPGLHCDLFLEKHAGSQIYVVGMVTKPGRFEISKPVSIIEALGLASGVIKGANLESIFVVRKHEQSMVATRIDLKKTLSFTKESRIFYLKPNDIVYVPRTWISSAAEVADDLSKILFFRGWTLGFSWQLHDAEAEDNSGIFD